MLSQSLWVFLCNREGVRECGPQILPPWFASPQGSFVRQRVSAYQLRIHSCGQPVWVVSIFFKPGRKEKMTSIARPPQPLPNSRMRWPGLTRAFCKTWWILRSWAASRSPEVGPSSRSPRRPPSASDQRAQEYIISLLRKAWKRWGPSKVLMKHENNYLKQFIWLVITGYGVEPRLRASLAKETVVKARNSRRHLCDRRWEGLFHPWLIVEPKLRRKRN